MKAAFSVVLLPVAVLGLSLACARNTTGRPSPPGPSSPETEGSMPTPRGGLDSLPWIVLEKTGGIAGFRLSLTVMADGSWTGRDLAHEKTKTGTFSPSELDSLRSAADLLPPEAWGSHPTQVVDDFNYVVSVRRDDVVMTMEGGGTALPAQWRPLLRLLERPLPMLWRD